MFSLHQQFYEEPSWSVFVPVTKKPVTWSYRGEYKFAVSGSLPPDEFRTQRPGVKHTWAKRILENVEHSVYRELRARIYLRKKGRSITPQRVASESQRIRDGKAGKLEESDVISALSIGQEMLSVVALTCVDFDHKFNECITERWKSWVPKARN
ncbi:hypothetical protein BV22DRAFT_266809 [Leucogyrophana mollusca]|uniref:Uncharacterized protein n=1 Tax=Leucogyrophana mollusca TaxID=85980 RepID=A0ACB8BNV6_9AGAM|nr:hypothetical protein BV22DRAFT_266809 [Leucogyrophana mollusca]